MPEERCLICGAFLTEIDCSTESGWDYTLVCKNPRCKTNRRGYIMDAEGRKIEICEDDMGEGFKDPIEELGKLDQKLKDLVELEEPIKEEEDVVKATKDVKLKHGMQIKIGFELFKVYRLGKNVTLKYQGKS